ncbi:MAG: tetratricopeptide repeat protein [Bacteroidota bacterium]
MNKTSTLILMLLCLASVACKKVSSHEDQEKILELEKLADESREQNNMGKAPLDTTLLAELGRAYLAYAESYPQANEAPEYLFRAGEVYSNELKDFPQAIAAFKKNYQDYPNHETAANALFFIGYLYNNSMRDIAEAETHYREFLDKYPNHNLAPHAEFELKSLGMSMEEVFNQLIGQDSTAAVDSTMAIP